MTVTIRKTFYILVFCVLLSSLMAEAATYNWTPTAAGPYNWDNADSQNNWSSGFPNAIDDIANVTRTLTAAQTINLNQTITVGTLNIGCNSASTGLRYTINANGGSLVMDVSSGNATISKTYLKDPDTINADIQLNTNLTLNSSSSDGRGYLVINGVISGSGQSLTKTGSNLARLVGTHTYDGGTTISAGTFQLGSGSGANSTVVGSIVNNGWLSFYDANARSFSAADYSGTGGLDKLGAGTLTLTGDFDVNGGLKLGYTASGGTVLVGSGGSLAVGSGSTDHLYIGVGYNGAGGSGTLDVTNTTSFTVNAGTIYVGINALYPYGGGSSGGSGAAGTGTLRLGTNNSITAASKIVIGGGDPDANTGITSGCNGYVTTAPGGVTSIDTPYMALGTAKGTQGSFTLGTDATLNLGTSGSRTELIVGRNLATANTTAGTMNLSAAGGVASLYLSRLFLGYVTAGGTVTGTMTLSSSESNNLNISGSGNVLIVGANTSGSGTAAGTLTIGNIGVDSAITSTDNSAAVVIAKKSSGTSTGALNLNGGILTITTTGSAIAGGGGTCSLNLKDCTLKAGASSTNWITGLTSARLTNSVAFNTAGYDIAVPQGLSGTGGFVKDGVGTLTLTGVNTYSGGTTVSNGNLLVNGSVTGLVTAVSGAGFGGTGTVGGNLVLESGATAVLTPDSPLNVLGSVTLNNNVVHLNIPEGLDIGVYTLMTYNNVGSSGSFSTAPVIDTGSAGGSLSLSESEGQVDLRVFAGGAVYRFR